MTTSIQNKLKLLPNYKILKDFESENYLIETKKDNKKDIFKFRNKRKTIISFEDFWKSGIGKIKKCIFEKEPNHWFIQQYGNFTGITLEDMIFDEKVFLNSKVIFKNSRLENCKFSNLSIYPFKDPQKKEVDICYLNFAGSIFIGCEFSKSKISFESIINCSFYHCQNFECFIFKDGINEYNAKETNIFECNFNKCKFCCNFNNINITNSSFVDSSIKYYSFNQCRLENNTFTKCDLSGTKFYANNTFIKNIFAQNNFYGADLSNIIFEEDNLFKDNNYNRITEISSNYTKVYKNNCIYKVDTSNYENIANIHHNFYNELKSTIMKEQAYEHFYIYKKLSMLKYLPTVCQNTMYSLIFMDKFIKQIFITFVIFFVPNILGMILSTEKYSIAIIIIVIILAIIYNRFFVNFLSYAICGFGERPRRAFISMSCVVLGCAYMFMHTGVMVNIAGGGNYEIVYDSIFTHSYLKSRYIVLVDTCTFIKDYFRCLYFSIITFTTIGFGDVVPITGWAKLLAMIEAVSSIFLINIFTATFIRKMIRD